jgi:hypothetical protein
MDVMQRQWLTRDELTLGSNLAGDVDEIQETMQRKNFFSLSCTFVPRKYQTCLR